mmetsp:Transcript_9203/g.13821  ORF Transcript_9203/g.13821 Transcript_9203/m.13821 type:complete len:761 (+) Transcript_9203:61-2343(+)
MDLLPKNIMMIRRSKRISNTTHKIIKTRSDCANVKEAVANKQKFDRAQASVIDQDVIVCSEKTPDPLPLPPQDTSRILGTFCHSHQQAQATEDEDVRLEAIRKRAVAAALGEECNQRKSKRQREQDKRWLRMFEELLAFRMVNGHTKVPIYYAPCQELGSWAACLWRQHRELQEGKTSNLTREKIDVLGLVGFWGIGSVKAGAVPAGRQASSRPHICQGWNSKFEQLKEYKRNFGHTNVPKNYEKNPTLANWVKTQRKNYRLLMNSNKASGAMTNERIGLLKSIGFNWVVQRRNRDSVHLPQSPAKRVAGLYVTDELNKKRLRPESMKAEKNEEIHKISKSNVSVKNVGQSLLKLRKSKRQQEKEKKWIEMFNRLKVYRELTGHCDVPQWCPGNQELGSFVASQREQYRYFQEGKSFTLMTDEKVAMLMSIGFVWDPSLYSQVTGKKETSVDYSDGICEDPSENAQNTRENESSADDSDDDDSEELQPPVTVDDSYVPTSPVRVDKNLVEKYSIALATASQKGRSTIQHALFSQKPSCIVEEAVTENGNTPDKNLGASIRQTLFPEKPGRITVSKVSPNEQTGDDEGADKCVQLVKNAEYPCRKRTIVAKWKLKGLESNRGERTDIPYCYLPLYKGVTVRPSGKWQAQIYYSGKSRYVGVFDDQEEAGRVYEWVHRELKSSNGSKVVSKEEADDYFKATLKAAFEWHNSVKNDPMQGEILSSECSQDSHKVQKSTLGLHQPNSLCKIPKKKRKTLMDSFL